MGVSLKKMFRETHFHYVTTQTQSTTTASYFSLHLMAIVCVMANLLHAVILLYNFSLPDSLLPNFPGGRLLPTVRAQLEPCLHVHLTAFRIACISAPTAYKKIREIKPSNCDVKCLEYDERFKVFGEDFQFYDYKEPLDLPLDLKQSFDIVIADPPFLSEECLCKTAVTVKFLAKEKILLCTGKVEVNIS